MEPQEIVNLLPDPVTEWRYRRQLCAEAYERGHVRGFYDGYRAALKDLEKHWQVVAGKVAENAYAPTNAELEARRAQPARRFRVFRGGAA